MFIFKVLKSNDATEEEFQSALQCARDSVESILDNEDLLIKASGNTITIAHLEPRQSTSMSPLAIKERVKGCFCDGGGRLYSEFSKVILQ